MPTIVENLVILKFRSFSISLRRNVILKVIINLGKDSHFFSINDMFFNFAYLICEILPNFAQKYLGLCDNQASYKTKITLAFKIFASQICFRKNH